MITVVTVVILFMLQSIKEIIIYSSVLLSLSKWLKYTIF